MSKFNVGDTVWISTFGRKRVETTVSKVGRKYVTADGVQFHIGNGRMKGEFMGQIWTEEEHLEDEERARLTGRLDSYGLQQRLGVRLTLERLRAICKALEEDK